MDTSEPDVREAESHVTLDDAPRIVDTSGTPTAVIVESTTWDAFPERWPRLLGEVWTFLRGSDLRAGRNVMVYRDDLPTVEVGVEVDRPFPAAGRVVPSALPAGRAVGAAARGALSAGGLAQAHGEVRAWCAGQGLALTGVGWEVYGHWLEDQDPARYGVEVYWLVG